MCDVCIYLLGDPILYDSRTVKLKQSFSRQTVDETYNSLLATFCAESILLLIIIDHLLEPGERRHIDTFVHSFTV